MLIWMDITAYQLKPLSNIIRVEDGKTLSRDRKGGGGWGGRTKVQRDRKQNEGGHGEEKWGAK